MFDDFHRCCDGKGPTITFIMTASGARCGGFTSVSWMPVDDKREDKTSFVFRIDTGKHWKPDPTKFEIQLGKEAGPQFGFNTLRFGNEPMSLPRIGISLKGGQQSTSYDVHINNSNVSELTG